MRYGTPAQVNVRKKHAAVFITVALAILAMAAALPGCDTFTHLPFWSTAQKTSPVGVTPTFITPAPPQNKTLTPGNTPTSLSVTPAPPPLTLWLPPQFDPDGNNLAAGLLKDRLKAFSDAHGGIKIVVRIKATSGPGGLLDALSATSAAAPAALPNLVALSRSDLETATLKGLLYPFDGKVIASDNPDWYNYARQMAYLQGSPYGLPFAGDAMILVYRPSLNPKPPVDWNGLIQLHENGALSFPASDPQSTLTLALYESTGAPIEDSQQRPTLNADAFASVLKIYASGAKEGVFPYWLTQYSTDAQAWQVFQDKRVNWVVTWTSRYLSVLPPDGAILPLFSLSKTPFTLATGWEWALVSPQPGQRDLSTQLAEFLVDSNFLSRWTSAAGYLPTRPSALAGWSDRSLQAMLNQVVLSAQLRPSSETMLIVGPVMEDAVLQVLKGQADPTQAAQTAADHLKGQ